MTLETKLGLPWEQVATTTRYGRYASSIERDTLLHAISIAGPPGDALELGCEGGRWSRMLADRGWHCTCVDVSEPALQICQERIPGATCIHANAQDTAIPCATGSIDLALCIEVAPIMHSDWIVDELVRVLRPGGMFVGVMWNRFSWRGWMYHHIPAVRASGSNYWYGYPLSYPAWRSAFRAKGFVLENEAGYAWPPVRRRSDSRLVTLATGAERYLGLRRLATVSPMIAFVARKSA